LFPSAQILLFILDGAMMILQALKQTLHTTKAGLQFVQVKFREELHNLGRADSGYPFFAFCRIKLQK